MKLRDLLTQHYGEGVTLRHSYDLQIWTFTDGKTARLPSERMTSLLCIGFSELADDCTLTELHRDENWIDVQVGESEPVPANTAGVITVGVGFRIRTSRRPMMPEVKGNPKFKARADQLTPEYFWTLRNALRHFKSRQRAANEISWLAGSYPHLAPLLDLLLASWADGVLEFIDRGTVEHWLEFCLADQGKTVEELAAIRETCGKQYAEQLPRCLAARAKRHDYTGRMATAQEIDRHAPDVLATSNNSI